ESPVVTYRDLAPRLAWRRAPGLDHRAERHLTTCADPLRGGCQDVGFARLVHAASATARLAITPTRCARYSAEPWMSELSPADAMAIPAIASGVNPLASAASIAGTRNTQGPAPVT